MDPFHRFDNQFLLLLTVDNLAKAFYIITQCLLALALNYKKKLT